MGNHRVLLNIVVAGIDAGHYFFSSPTLIGQALVILRDIPEVAGGSPFGAYLCPSMRMTPWALSLNSAELLTSLPSTLMPPNCNRMLNVPLSAL